MQNPFGAAKPREAVLADKLGVKEEDVLKKEVLKDRVKVGKTVGRQTVADALRSNAAPCRASHP